MFSHVSFILFTGGRVHPSGLHPGAVDSGNASRGVCIQVGSIQGVHPVRIILECIHVGNIITVVFLKSFKWYKILFHMTVTFNFSIVKRDKKNKVCKTHRKLRRCHVTFITDKST